MGDDQEKRLLTQVEPLPVFAVPGPNSPFELHTDASWVGTGAAVLMQNVGGAPRVVSLPAIDFPEPMPVEAPPNATEWLDYTMSG